MNPDLNRLCLAAWCADSGALPGAFAHRSEEDEARTERVVRAVLTELSQGWGLPLSDKVIAAGATAYHQAESRGDYIAMDVFVAMVSAILAEPAIA